MSNVTQPSPEKLALANPALFCNGRWYVLPIMPSLNNAFVNKQGGGRFASRQYAAWKQEAGWKLRDIKPQPVKGRYALHTRLPVKMRGDIDNRAKALSDLLVSVGITPDDSKLWKLHVERHESVKPNTCEFRLEAIDG